MSTVIFWRLCNNSNDLVNSMVTLRLILLPLMESKDIIWLIELVILNFLKEFKSMQLIHIDLFIVLQQSFIIFCKYNQSVKKNGLQMIFLLWVFFVWQNLKTLILFRNFMILIIRFFNWRNFRKKSKWFHIEIWIRNYFTF